MSKTFQIKSEVFPLTGDKRDLVTLPVHTTAPELTVNFTVRIFFSASVNHFSNPFSCFQPNLSLSVSLSESALIYKALSAELNDPPLLSFQI